MMPTSSSALLVTRWILMAILAHRRAGSGDSSPGTGG